jgi:hypothetical protein
MIRHIDIDVSVKKWVDEEDEQNLYAILFNRKFRMSMDFPLNMQDGVFRAFLHERLDKIINELESQMEAMNEQIS